MKFETWLPVFPGFYNTVFDPNIDEEHYSIMSDGIMLGDGTVMIPSKEASDELFTLIWEFFDNDAYERDVSLQAVDIIKSNCPLIETIEYEKIASPREYNYANDSINCIITVDLDKLRKWIYSEKEMLNKYLKDHYTSYDGFMSFFPNSFEEWEEETTKFTEFGEHEIGSILNAWFESIGYNEECLYEEIDSNICEYIDYKKVVEEIRKKKLPFEIKKKEDYYEDQRVC